MSRFGLEERHIKFLLDVLREYLPDGNVKFYVFGSRAKGSYKEYSDVDIALKGENEIPFENLLKLKSEFENSTFPYEVDIVDLNTISKNFLNIIKDDLTPLM